MRIYIFLIFYTDLKTLDHLKYFGRKKLKFPEILMSYTTIFEQFYEKSSTDDVCNDLCKFIFTSSFLKFWNICGVSIDKSRKFKRIGNVHNLLTKKHWMSSPYEHF